MRGLIVIAVVVCFLFGCSSYTGKASQWDYYAPEHVRCFDNETKFCRRFGKYMICECIA